MTSPVTWLVITFCLFSFLQTAAADIYRKKFSTTSPNMYLVIEVLDNDLIHFEVSAVGNGPDTSTPLYVSPMIAKTTYSGASSVQDTGNTLETRDIKIYVNEQNLCITAWDKTNSNAFLTTICPAEMSNDWKGLNIAQGNIQKVYGLGQQFKQLASADGDWIEHGMRNGQPSGQQQSHGNGFMPFGQAGLVGNIQFPVLYALGDNKLNYGLFIDNVYKQDWDFSSSNWQVRMWGDQLHFYLMAGKDLPDIRSDYMELTGRPPVLPKKSLGLWVSEFGYKNWEEVNILKNGLRKHDFPLDGFVLDLFWFGGIKDSSPDSPMGKLDWDSNNKDGNDYYFPNPKTTITDLSNDHIGLVAIEESYINLNTNTFTDMQSAGKYLAYKKTGNQCDPTNYDPIAISEWFGHAAMVDWSNEAAGKWVHDNRRYPNLVANGIYSHWTDLGEPEKYNADACYKGVETNQAGVKNTHGDIHNLYAFQWVKSIYDGYFDKRNQINNRSFVVTRSGAPGVQRFGAALWSGDIGANLDLLATHSNAQMHMSFSGVDYYGADVGGFRREGIPYNGNHSGNRQYEDELYTQWFANASWFDIPIRPHTDNAFQTAQDYETSPHLIGHLPSNRANLRQRYELIPYYYSLAYRAHLFGEPVIPPLVMYYQDDAEVRNIGHQKLIGKDILVGLVAKHGEYMRNIYLPSGTWVNYHTQEWINSSGQWLNQVPSYQKAQLTLPAFARAGAIIPQMWVDANTKDVFGHRKNQSAEHQELILKVYADPAASSFTLYEDDGETLSYDDHKTPVYQTRTTLLSQQQSGNSVTVTVAAAEGSYSGASTTRNNLVRLVVNSKQAVAVSLNGSSLPQYSSYSRFLGASSGWFNTGDNLIIAKSGVRSVKVSKKFTFALNSTSPYTSAYFICDEGWTNTGEEIYITGDIPQLGNWDPKQGIKLDANVYHEYIHSPPPAHNGPGPNAPVWTQQVHKLPPNTRVQWKCVKKLSDNSWHWETGSNNELTTVSSGYSGSSYGSF